MSKAASDVSYELYVSYDPDMDDLASSLDFLSKAISNQANADKLMVHGLSAEVSTKIVLDDIKKSSIRLILVNTFKNINEDEIHEKGIKAYWHQFLVEIRKPFLDYATKHETLEKREDLIELRNQAAQIARENKINPLLIEGMQDEKIAKHLADYSVPHGLSANQEFKVICGEQVFSINKNFRVTPDQIAAILECDEQTLIDQTVYVKPKTVVYEGDGMWNFYVPNNSTTIKGKILDEEWLKNFQQGKLASAAYPFPGTILKARADIIIKFDESNFRKGEIYHIKKIYGPVPPDEIKQEIFDPILNLNSENQDNDEGDK